VEDLLAKASFDGETHYQVKWAQYEEVTWESEDYLIEHCKQLIRRFDEKWQKFLYNQSE
jgi:Chromo (CHRromatin Organisation MOdifier) domain